MRAFSMGIAVIAQNSHTVRSWYRRVPPGVANPAVFDNQRQAPVDIRAEFQGVLGFEEWARHSLRASPLSAGVTTTTSYAAQWADVDHGPERQRSETYRARTDPDANQ